MFKKKNKILTYPTHIAFIMDGNRRWATERGLNKMLGHKQGAVAMKNMISTLAEYPDIRYASFFAFSTENWNREQSEIDYLFELCYDFVDEYKEKFENMNIKFVSMGDATKFPEKLQNILIKTAEETKNNTGLVVNFAMNYGGRDDIVRSANIIAERGEKITVENLKENLYSAPAPDIDLLIRTSGEMRVSNFMLYQMAYSEFYFTKKHWPDFDKRELDKALVEFSKRNRRFGGK